MAEERPPKQLRSIEQLSEAHEWLFDQVRTSRIDSKTGDILNTVLKGSVYLNARLKLDYAKLVLMARKSKVDFPEGLLPELPPSQRREA